MGIRYDRTEWENEKTPVNQDNMNNIELGIVNATDAINKLLDGILPAARAIADEDGNNLKMTLINKADLVGGKVPANQLPSYVSNIVEVETYEDLPNPGEGSTIYVVKNPVETTYRWTGSTYISTDEQSQYYSVKIDTSNIVTMGDLHDYIISINSSGLHCFFDLSDFVENAYICTILMFTKNLINYCLIFDVINGKTYIDYNGYQITDLVQDYVNRTGDNVPRIISLNDSNLLVGDISTLLDEINTVGHHVIFDFHELQANCYLCTVLIDTQNNQITIADLVGFRTVTRNYDEYTTLVSLLESLEPVSGGSSEVVSITYSELLALKAEGNLSPGTFYRITDYQTTVPASMTPIGDTRAYSDIVRSAGHQFDIIVEALTNSELNVNAKACLHEGDTYFINSKLQLWELKYDIDGTLNEYDWSVAGTDSFKGIIFYMKDEFNNESYFDFKNILFKAGQLYKYSQVTWFSNYNMYASQFVYLFCKTNASGSSMTQDNILDASLTNVDNCKINLYNGNRNNKKYYRLNFSFYQVKNYNIYNIIVENAHHITLCSGGNLGMNIRLLGTCSQIFRDNLISILNLRNCTKIDIVGSQCDDITIKGAYNVQLGFNTNHITIGSNCQNIISVNSGLAYTTIGNFCENLYFNATYACWFSKIGNFCRNINFYSGHNSIDLTDSCCNLEIGYVYQAGSTNPRTNNNCHIYIDHVGGKNSSNKVQLIGDFANNFDGRIVYEGYGDISSSSGFPSESTYANYKIVAKLTDKNNITNVYQYDTTTQVWSDITKHLYKHQFTATNFWTNSQHVTSKNCFLQATFESTSPTPMTWANLVEATLEQGKTLYYEYTDQNMSRIVLKRIDVKPTDNTLCVRKGYSTYNADGTIFMTEELISTVKAYDFLDLVDTVEQLD